MMYGLHVDKLTALVPFSNSWFVENTTVGVNRKNNNRNHNQIDDNG